MFARVGTWQGSHEELQRWVSRASQAVKPKVAQQEGIVTALWLVDWASCKGLTITVWKSEEAMRKSEQFREQSQHQTSDATGAAVTTERYEVVDHL